MEEDKEVEALPLEGVPMDLYSAIADDNADEVDKLAKLLHEVDLDDLKVFEKFDKVPLVHAIDKKAVGAMRALLGNGASSNGSHYKYDIPALHYAAKTKSVEIVKLLLDYGAEVNRLCYSELTALILACRTGELGMVKLLLDKGANINHIGKFEAPPLGLRMDFDYCYTEYFDRHVEPWRFNTPLIEACRFRHWDIVRELLDRGADVNLVATPGKTALLVAAFCKSPQPFHHDLDDNAKFAILPAYPPILKLLIERGACVTILNNFDETAAQSVLHHICIISRYEKITKYVVETLQYFYINLCLLVKAGCPLPTEFEMNLDTRPHIEDRHVVKTLHILSEAYTATSQVESSVPLDEAYTSAMTVALLSGLKPGKEDIKFIEGRLQDSKTKESILSLLKGVAGEGYTLRQHCQIRLREMARRPLFTHIMSDDFKLPVFLKRCILLDRDVPTDSWLDNYFDWVNYPGYGPITVRR